MKEAGAHAAPTRLYRVASWISGLTNPKITVTSLLVYIAAFSRANMALFLTFVAYSIANVSFTRWAARGAPEHDSHEFDHPMQRRKRYLTFVFFIGACGIYGAFAYVLGWGFEQWYFMYSAVTTGVVLALTRAFHFKASAHICYLGLVILFVVEDGIAKYLVLLTLGPLIGWSRIKLGNHSLSQIAATTALLLAVFASWDLMNI